MGHSVSLGPSSLFGGLWLGNEAGGAAGTRRPVSQFSMFGCAWLRWGCPVPAAGSRLYVWEAHRFSRCADEGRAARLWREGCCGEFHCWSEGALLDVPTGVCVFWATGLLRGQSLGFPSNDGAGGGHDSWLSALPVVASVAELG